MQVSCVSFLIRILQTNQGVSVSFIHSIPLTEKLSSFLELPADDVDLLDSLHRKRRSFPAGREMLHEGQIDRVGYILISGWACSYKLLPDGKRQIVNFQIPGDFMGLRSSMLRTSGYSLESISDIVVVEVCNQVLFGGRSESPKLTAALLWAAARDTAMMVEHIVNLGRRDARTRMAHFLLELEARLALVGLAGKAGYRCPLTQYHLGDALGLSSVHVNRVLRDLREAGLVSFQAGKVEFLDHRGLTELADFDPAYLDQTPRIAA